MISKFFIDRPIFAAVLSIVITLAGAIAYFTLPIAQYPPISPPTVQIDCKFPGASARDVAQSVASPIEQQVNGVEGMLYMSSQCTNDGSYNLTVTFKHGMDLNMAQVLVQNRVALALPLLPDVIKQTGVTTRKKAPDILMAIAINSPGGKRDQLYLSNYALMHIKEELGRLPGVSDVTMMGQQDYSMRIWVDPEKLAARNLSASDIVRALREQNRPVATGQIGQPPVPKGQALQVTLATDGRLVEPEEFGQIVVKVQENGSAVRIRDIARVEMGAKNMDMMTSVNGKPSVSMAIFQLPDANALDTAIVVKDKIAEMKKDWPRGVDYEIRYDTTPFISESINEVFKTLREAVILVALVVLLFLQNWRSALIPLIAVPVAIIGTFAVMLAMGFSINNLTLFGLVLAIGIVVDDAIVVVEAVEHHMEHGLAPRAATIVAMEEVSGPVIAIGLVLTAVFVPCAFISGIVGQFFKQFALTIAASTVISTFNSLTLSPALAALLLRPPGESKRDGPLPKVGIAALGAFFAYESLLPRVLKLAEGRHLPTGGNVWWAWLAGVVLLGLLAGWLIAPLFNRLLGAFFAGFNRAFRWATGIYTFGVGLMLKGLVVVLVIYGGLLYLTKEGFDSTPKGVHPVPGHGISAGQRAAPRRRQPGADEGVDGRDGGDGPQGAGRPAHAEHDRAVDAPERLGLELRVDVHHPRRLLEAARPEAERRRDPQEPRGPVQEEGPRGDDHRPAAPPGARRRPGRRLQADGRGPGRLRREDPPEPDRRADRRRQGGQGRRDRRPALRRHDLRLPGERPAALRQGRPQGMPGEAGAAEGPLRHAPDLPRLALRQRLQPVRPDLAGDRPGRPEVPQQPRVRQAAQGAQRVVDDGADRLGRRGAGGHRPAHPAALQHVHGRPDQRQRRPGAVLGPGDRGDGDARQQAAPAGDEDRVDRAGLPRIAGRQHGHDDLRPGGHHGLPRPAWPSTSWSALPLAVILVVPMCLLSSITGCKIGGQDINIFTQIGFVVLVGLACKNAILIVEFARAQRIAGMPRREAALEACRLRLRPIIMTSMAFILGVFPLLTARGAGAEMRRTLGTTVFSGMLGVTLFGILLTPVFFVLVDWMADTKLFRSRTLRFVARLLIDILTLGLLRLVMVLASRRARRPATKAPKPALSDAELDALPAPVLAANGNGHGHANGDGEEEEELEVVSAHGNGHTNGNGNGHTNGNGNGHAYEAVAVVTEPANGADGNGHRRPTATRHPDDEDGRGSPVGQ